MSYTPYPEGVTPPAKPKIALMHITIKEQEMWDPDSKWSLYESLSTAKLYRDWGYDVDILASKDIVRCKRFDKVSASDYDLVVVQSAGPVFVGDKGQFLHPANEAQYLFLASVPDGQTIVVLGNDMALPFVDIQQIKQLDSKYRESKWRIKARTKFFSQTENLAHSAKNLDRREPIYMRSRLEYVPIWSHSVNWLGSIELPEVKKSYDVAYPGRARTFTDRGARLAKLLPERHFVLWTGTSREKAEKWLGKELRNVNFEKGTSNKVGAILSECYNRGVATIIPYEPAFEQIVTPRMVEACSSTAVVFVDDKWPASSAMFRYFPALNNRRVADGEDLLASIPADTESMLVEQQAMISSLWSAVEQYRKAIDKALVENIRYGEKLLL